MKVETRAYLEIYKTKSQFKDYAYIPNEDFKAETSNNDETEKLMFDLAKSTETRTVNELLMNISMSKDYTEMDGEMSVELPLDTYSVYKDVLQKGRRCKLIILKLKNDKTVNRDEQLGFIKNITFKNNSIQVDLINYEVLLNHTGSYDSKLAKRSTHLKNIIEMSGMKSAVDLTGLHDDLIWYTNYQDSGGGVGSNLPKGSKTDASSSIELRCRQGTAKQVVGYVPPQSCYQDISNSKREYYKDFNGKSQDYVIRQLRKLFHWTYWSGNRDANADVTYKKLKRGTGCNCADAARVMKACLDASGHPCIIIHHYDPNPMEGHFFNMVKKGNKWLTVDLCYKSNLGKAGSTNAYGV